LGENSLKNRFSTKKKTPAPSYFLSHYSGGRILTWVATSRQYFSLNMPSTLYKEKKIAQVM
jgi:hypothetical protein